MLYPRYTLGVSLTRPWVVLRGSMETFHFEVQNETRSQHDGRQVLYGGQ
jgi:hypothetical protein